MHSAIERPTMLSLLLDFAEQLTKRSTCSRLGVGAIVTDERCQQVFGFGYNGNAAGLANTCDSLAPGACGCVHAEINALLKAPGLVPNKLLISTCAPCLACAKAAINANIAHVCFARPYRDARGLDALYSAGVRVTQIVGASASDVIAYDRGLLNALAAQVRDESPPASPASSFAQR